METETQKQMYFITQERPEANSCNKRQRKSLDNDKRVNWLKNTALVNTHAPNTGEKKYIIRIH